MISTNLRTLAVLKAAFPMAAVFPVTGRGFDVVVGEEEVTLHFSNDPVCGEIVGYDAYGRHHTVAIH